MTFDFFDETILYSEKYSIHDGHLQNIINEVPKNILLMEINLFDPIRVLLLRFIDVMYYEVDNILADPQLPSDEIIGWGRWEGYPSFIKQHVLQKNKGKISLFVSIEFFNGRRVNIIARQLEIKPK